MHAAAIVQRERYNSNPRGQMVIVPNKVDDMALLRFLDFCIDGSKKTCDQTDVSAANQRAQFLLFRVLAGCVSDMKGL